jgi:N-acetylmuramoyl-L-alanine amidase
MIPDFARKNEFKARQDMLRGVYEENLVILGKGRHPLARRRPFPLKRVLIYTVACIFAFLISGRYQGTSFSPSELTANMITYPISPPAARLSSEGTPNISGFTPFMKSDKVPVSRMLGLKIKRIMIDAGHGGGDPGSIGKMGTMEKNITLDIAKRLKAHIVKNSYYHVRMTREGDSSVPLHKRIALAQQAKADLFISIHVNSLPNMPINIIETYYFGPSNDERTLKLAEEENAGSEYGLSDFREVVERLGQTMKLQESKEFAESIQANLFLNSRKQCEEIKNYGVKRAPFVVLLGLDVPSVLAEVSCLSNPEEERELNSETHREHIAAYLAAGVFNYLNKGALKNEAKR